jgi:hypothetical protein
MANEIDRFDAITSLVGGIIMHGDEVTYVYGQTPPTEEAIQAELTRLQAEYEAKEYQRKRKAEYPSVQDLVVALYDTEDKTAIDAKRAEIKLKYPKPGA